MEQNSCGWIVFAAFVLVFIIFMYLQGIEVPNVAFGLAGALIGILTKCILNSWKNSHG